MSRRSRIPSFAPDQTIEHSLPSVLQRIAHLRESLAEGSYDGIAGGFGSSVMTQQLQLMNADEGTVWVVDKQSTGLVPVWNNGPTAEKLLSSHRQPLGSGLISMVFATETTICESDVHHHKLHDSTVDRLTGSKTTSMVAVPWHCAGAVLGVLSAVKLVRDDDSPPVEENFRPEAVRQLSLAAAALGAWIDCRLFATALGLGRL